MILGAKETFYIKQNYLPIFSQGRETSVSIDKTKLYSFTTIQVYTLVPSCSLNRDSEGKGKI